MKSNSTCGLNSRNHRFSYDSSAIDDCNTYISVIQILLQTLLDILLQSQSIQRENIIKQINKEIREKKNSRSNNEINKKKRYYMQN